MTLAEKTPLLLAALQPAGHVRPWEWLLFIVPMGLLSATLAYCLATGESGDGHALLAPVRRVN